MPTDTLTLQRQPSTDEGTFGQFFRNGRQIAVTAELPWNDNQAGRSCVPAGTYLCVHHDSPHHPDTWEITGVPGRSNILLHAGNVPVPYTDDAGVLHRESLGCILVGDTYGTVNGQKAVLNSVKTLDKLRLSLPRTFTLTILPPEKENL